MYDLAIIGAGPAGYVAAERAGHNGLKTIIFDKRELGGVCLNEGCIPTKTLLFSAKVYEYAKHGEKYGVKATDVHFDYPAMLKRKEKVVRKLVAGVAAKMKSNHVEVVKASAEIIERTNDMVKISADGKIFESKNVLIATGSETFVPPIPGLDKTEYLTSREILELKELPSSLTIIGGGVIGMEFAAFYTSLGVKVSVIEMVDEILPGIDLEIAAMFRKIMEEKGTAFFLSSKVVEVKGNEVFYEKEGKKSSIVSDKLLVSVGRRAVTKGLGLDKIGVVMERGGIKVDKRMRTNLPNVYAAGDVKGFALLAHTASREGEVVVNNLCGRPDEMRYDANPGVVYTNPEISGVGLTEDKAKEKGIDYRVVKLPMVYAGRFIAENEGTFQGLCKVIVGKKYDQVLGVHMIGNPSSEMIYGACMALEMQMTLKELQQVIFPHPTVSEIFKEVSFL